MAGRNRHDATRHCLGLLATALALAALLVPPAANAAPEPGVPVAVAPGVPGHGRSWELVTPEDQISTGLGDARAISADGNQILYKTIGTPPGAPTGKPLFFPSLAVRGAAGWVSRPLSVPDPETINLFGIGAEALTPDFGSVVWSNETRPAVEGGSWGLSLYRGPLAGPFSHLVEIGSGYFLGASPDLGRTVFTSNLHLLPSDAGRGEGYSIYELEGAQLRQVDLSDGGSLISPCGVKAAPSGVSRDARRIFFSSEPGCGAPRVFLRENGATTEISASQCELPDCGPELGAEFATATPDGSVAFLISAAKLTDDASGESSLFRYDVASGGLSVVASAGAAGQIAAQVRTSPDGSQVYFSVNGNETSDFYRSDADGVHGPLPISNETFLQWSADSRYSILTTAAPLLSSDQDASSDLYRYDAQQHAYTQISIGTGGRGNGPAEVSVAPDFFSEGRPSQPFRAMSLAGSRIFFTTSEALLPEDGNAVADVYEWADGDLALISPGAGDRPALFLGATPDGRTALFRTSLTLMPRDRDGGSFDFYAARIGGGFPEPPTAPPPCDGEACRPQVRGGGPQGVPRGSAPSRRIRLRPLDAAARRHALRGGELVLLAEVPKAGRLAATARARVGGRARTIAATTVDVARPGPVRLRMPLRAAARRALERGRSLRARLVVSLPRLRPAAMRIELGGGR